jgi:hypothetical protein
MALQEAPTNCLALGSEITALHSDSFKMVLLHYFLQSIGVYLNTPTPTYEDNQGIMKLVWTHNLSDTVCRLQHKTFQWCQAL